MARKAFVTGGAGLVGRHMRRILEERKFEVIWCDLKAPSHTNAHAVFRNFDITERFDLIVHAAYHVGGRAAIDGQPDNLIKNIHLDSAMFEWAHRTHQPHVLYFSSSAAYPVSLQTGRERGPSLPRLQEDEIDLDYPELADGRYGLAKLTGEQMARATRQSSSTKVTVVRPFSGYSPDQDETYPFRALLERARRRDNPFVVWGSASQLRDWIHIDDVVRGALAVVESETEDPVNLCTGQGTAIGDLAGLMLEEVGTYDDVPLSVDDTKPMGVMNRVGDPTRFFEYYEPRISIEQAVHDALRED